MKKIYANEKVQVVFSLANNLLPHLHYLLIDFFNILEEVDGKSKCSSSIFIS